MKIAMFSLCFYFLYLMVSKLLAKVIKNNALIIASKCEKVENKEYTKNTDKRVTLKISTPIAILICFIPILNILFDILIFVFLYMELLVLFAMKNTLNEL